MATTAALGKTCAKPAISAALFGQDHFCTRTARFSTKLYFHDQAGNTLGFVRNASFAWNKEIRLFTDPGLSFELLTIKPLPGSKDSFEIADSINHERVGVISLTASKGLEKRQWVLADRSGIEIGDVVENSLICAHLRRKLTDFVSQTYAIRMGDRTVGEIFEKSNISAHHLEVDISADSDRKLDRRLLAGFLVLLQAGFSRGQRQ